DDPFTIHQDEYKQAYARRGHSAAEELVERAVGKNAPAKPTAIDVFSTSSWDRDDIVTIEIPAARSDVSMRNAEGQPLAVQHLADGKLAFRAASVPALAAARFTLSKEELQATGSAYADAKALTIGNDLVQLEI